MKTRISNDAKKLKRSIKSDDASGLQKLIKAGLPPDGEISIDDWIPPKTLLAYACECKAARTINLLVKAGADLNRGKYSTPLIAAIAAGAEDIVKLLLDAGADPNAAMTAGHVEGGSLRQNPGWTPLMSAASVNNLGIAELLLERGGDPNCVTKIGHSALKFALEQRDSALADRLLKAGAKATGASLFAPVNRGDAATVRKLLEAGADPNAVGTRADEAMKGQTPIEVATRERAQVFGTEKLTLKMAEVRGTTKRAVQEIAAKKEGYRRVIQELLGAGARVNERVFWKSSLYMAAEAGDLELVELFLASGAVPDQAVSAFDEDEPDETALHVAAKEGHLEVVERLLKAGASTRKKNSNGKTPLQVARRGSKVARLLVARRR
jgi:ankyrin repeat protein